MTVCLADPVDSGKRPFVSVVLGVRNEYPVILGTIHSFVEDLEHHGYPYEIVVVDNMSTDNTAWILRDKFRRWIREGLLKVIEWNERPANVTVRNIGAREAKGEVVFLADGHLSIKVGTLHGMIQGWIANGGLWHSSINIWGDTTNIRCYGYDLKLRERFWGNLSRFVPAWAKSEDGVPLGSYTVPMASHCCLMAGREEFLDLGGYCEEFKCYGGGEPYLDLLYWTTGKKVWLYPQGLVRHAFGVNARWEEAKKEKRVRNYVQCEDGSQRADLKPGDKFLRYSRGYAWTNDDFQFNFMLSAFLIGGYSWLQGRYEDYYERRKGNERYVRDIKRLRQEVLRIGTPIREKIESKQVMTLDDLEEKRPWEPLSC